MKIYINKTSDVEKGRYSNVIALLLLMLLFLPGFIQAQKDSISYGLTNNQDTILKYISPMEYAFMMHEETSWLFKVNTTLTDLYRYRNYMKVGVEKRIAPSLTLELGLEQLYNEVPSEFPLNHGVHTSIESKWYYRLNKRIQQKNVARNMSDNYISIGVAYTRYWVNKGFSDWEDFTSPKSRSAISGYLKWGMQRRFLKNGHADMGFEVGLSNKLNVKLSPSFIFSTYVNMGLAFTKDKFMLDGNKLCPVLKCYDASNFALKSNVSSLLSLHLSEFLNRIAINPNIAFERKVGNSAFSINTEANGIYGYSEYYFSYNDSFNNSDFWRFGFQLEGRWYYNLKRRMLQGKTGNSLSANYITIGGLYNISKADYQKKWESQPIIYGAIGWQRFFGKHMYYDIQLGYEYFLNTEPNVQESQPRIKMGIGYRF
ncbi:MAG: hypothetical protein K9H58_17285 [Bacteroidales bacterium]|nr:hypothetical protein [Bacteroidales bacterium]